MSRTGASIRILCINASRLSDQDPGQSGPKWNSWGIFNIYTNTDRTVQIHSAFELINAADTNSGALGSSYKTRR